MTKYQVFKQPLRKQYFYLAWYLFREGYSTVQKVIGIDTYRHIIGISIHQKLPGLRDIDNLSGWVCLPKLAFQEHYSFFKVLLNLIKFKLSKKLYLVKTMRKIFSNYVCFTKSPNFNIVTVRTVIREQHDFECLDFLPRKASSSPLCCLGVHRSSQ